ncbi:MAG TPA: alpha/beta fold hydrolase [Candidatus Baltobacteraceae bacterium]|nr:alpha/beta fold hydrolase [Candidatus Baltobacteraceae bacterium]
MQLFFKEHGQGGAIVLLHGLFGSSDNWHYVAMQLSEQFRVFSLDQRNHGQSPHSDEMNYPLMAADVAEFLDSKKIQTATIIGHSLGGKTAMQFALQYPERTEKLIVEDMAPRAYASVYENFMVAMLALDLAKFQTRQQVEEALAPEIPDLTLRRFLLKNLGRNPDGKFFWKIYLGGIRKNAAALRAPISSAIPFTKPMLFIRGEKSDYVRVEDEKGIRQLFPNAKIETIVGSGHWVHSEKPEEFMRAVREFLG